MSQHVTVSSTEAADRLAIRELVEAYARCADRRDAKGQMALFTRDTHFVVYMSAKDPTPSMELNSRDALAPVFADLRVPTPLRTSLARAPSSHCRTTEPPARRTVWRITSPLTAATAA